MRVSIDQALDLFENLGMTPSTSGLEFIQQFQQRTPHIRVQIIFNTQGADNRTCILLWLSYGNAGIY